MSRASKKIGPTGDISLDGGIMSISIGEALGVPSKKAPSKGRSDANQKKSGHDAAPLDLASVQQAIVRRERAGRGGRTVTIVSLRPQMTPQKAEALAKEMRRALGCGARAEGSNTVLQGDIQERAQAWLADRGVKKAVLGN